MSQLQSRHGLQHTGQSTERLGPHNRTVLGETGPFRVEFLWDKMVGEDLQMEEVFELWY